MDGCTNERTLPASLLDPPPQACQAAIDQIEKRNETFKAAAQGPEGDAQEQEVNEGTPSLPELPASPRTDPASLLCPSQLGGQDVPPTMSDLKGPGDAHSPQFHPAQKPNAKDSPISQKFLWEPLYATIHREDFTSMCISLASGSGVCVCVCVHARARTHTQVWVWKWPE